MKNNRRTIKEIAQMAGVSPTAVSFVLNGKEGIGQDTRDRILEIIKETGFQPSAASQRLSLRKSFNLAVAYLQTASPFSDLFYYEIANGIISLASRHHYNVVFSPLEVRDGKIATPDIVLRNDVDGMVFLQEIDPEFLSRPDISAVPHVLVDLHTPIANHVHVSIDAEKSISRITEFLIRKGHRAIAFLGSGVNFGYYSRCFTGYQRAMKGIAVYPQWIQQAADAFSGVDACVEALLGGENPPTAICCTSDLLAINAMRAIKARGLSIPNDISITGIDDIVLSQYVEPRLTTVGFDKPEIGCLAGQLLMDIIEGKSVQSVIVKSDSIIERNSVSDLHGQP